MSSRHRLTRIRAGAVAPLLAGTALGAVAQLFLGSRGRADPRRRLDRAGDVSGQDGMTLQLWVDPADDEGRVPAAAAAASGRQRRITLPVGSYTVGPGEECDVTVAGGGSGGTALLEVTAAHCTVRPLTQDARLTVNGRRGGAHRLADGDRVQLGATTFGVHLPAEPVGPPARSLGEGSARGAWAGIALLIAAVVCAGFALVLRSAVIGVAAAVLGLTGLVLAWRSRVMNVATVTQDIHRVGEG